jgi:predicted nuclease of restriction endonuclease-like RecB superfamily
LLPDDLLPLRIKDGQAIVGYLGDGDQTWLRALIEEFERYAGRPERELRARLSEPLPLPSPFLQRRAATAVLSRLWRSAVQAALAPREIRRAVFDEMAAGGGSRSDILTRVGNQLGIAPALLAAGLFADLPGERIVVSPQAIPSPTDAVRRINLSLAQAMLFRATSVRIRAEGGVRPLVRLAKLRGLICAVSIPPGERAPRLEISGPYALFRRTLLYGRALAAIVPPLVASGRFSLQATCVVRGQALDFALATGDPVSAPEQGRHFDSQLEERFVRDLQKAAPDWDVIREPEPLRAGAGLVFPDFLLRHRRDPARSFLVEIVGFWTREYLEKKFAALRSANVDNLIICVDAERGCSEGDLPLGARVLRYKRKIDPAAVLALANHTACQDPRSRPTQ